MKMIYNFSKTWYAPRFGPLKNLKPLNAYLPNLSKTSTTKKTAHFFRYQLLNQFV